MKSPGSRSHCHTTDARANDKKLCVFEGANPDKKGGGVRIVGTATIWLPQPDEHKVNSGNTLSLRQDK